MISHVPDAVAGALDSKEQKVCEFLFSFVEVPAAIPFLIWHNSICHDDWTANWTTDRVQVPERHAPPGTCE